MSSLEYKNKKTFAPFQFCHTNFRKASKADILFFSSQQPAANSGFVGEVVAKQESRKIGVGFTLIELIIAIAIISIMSAILLPNYQNVRQQIALLQAGHTLAQNLRRAQEMTASARELPDGTVPPGYGIYLENNEENYILYADKNGNEKYSGVIENVEIIDLDKIYVKELSASSVSVNFKSPDPTTKITDNNDNDLNSITITLALTENPNQEKKVIVNKFGLIYVE